MKYLIMTCLVGILYLPARAADPAPFFHALGSVESGNNDDAPHGDNGAARGRYQIHRDFWQDANVDGQYEDVTDHIYAEKVITAYMEHYAPVAWANGDWYTVARTFQGPRGAHRKSTIPYANKVMRALEEEDSTK